MDLYNEVKNPAIEYWPEVRWWLAEGFHTDATLKKDIETIHSAGFGAVEFLAMDEQGADSTRYGWGAEEWVHDSQLVIDEATRRGMGASMTSGTNWSNANLTTIKPDDRAAAKELDYMIEHVPAGHTREGMLQLCELKRANVYTQELIAVVAARRVSENVYDHTVVLTDMVKGNAFSWTAPDDADYDLFTFWMHGTGQTALPSVSVSYTVNYIDRYGVDALTEYWEKEVLTEQMVDMIRRNGRVQMYMDSLELSTYGRAGQFWGYHLLEAFHARRGYDLTPYLPFIVKTAGGLNPAPYQYFYELTDSVKVGKIRNDLYQTMTELYMDNMLAPLQEWLHAHGMTLRAEISYGMPFEITLPGKYVDGIETESLEFASQLDSYRHLAGPAHIYNRLYSSETGATMMNYMMGLRFYTQIIYTQFAAGVARTVLHGYSSVAGADSSTYWPGHEGMLPIFSERFGVRQPAFQHYSDWTGMLARYQMLLRQGKPRMDIGILRLDYNFNNLVMMSGGGLNERDTYESKLMRAHEGLYWRNMALQDHGYTYDYLAPQMLEDAEVNFQGGEIAPDGPGYRALIIYQRALPISTAHQLLAWAKAGLRIVIVNGATEMVRSGVFSTYPKAADSTPFNDSKDAELRAIMAEIKALRNVIEVDDQSLTYAALLKLGVRPRVEFAEPETNVLPFLRQDGNMHYLYLYNYMYTHANPAAVEAAVEAIGKPYCIDCHTGAVTPVALYSQRAGRTVIPVTLAPGEAKMFAIDSAVSHELHAVACNAAELHADGEHIYAVSAQSGEYSVRLSDGREIAHHLRAPGDIVLSDWSLDVEDWNEGDKMTLHEDRGLGYVTDEVYYETSKARIHVGHTALKPWREIKQVGPDVSGVGYYSASFMLDKAPHASYGAYLKLGSTCGNSAAVYVNGRKAPAVNLDTLMVNVSGLVREGENVVTVEVASTLNNRLLARGYYKMVIEGLVQSMAHLSEELGGNGPEASPLIAEVQDYGLVGEVRLVLNDVSTVV